MIETQIKQTISKYKLCSKKEKILVALSGGKDSAVVAYVLKKLNYNVEAIHINLGFENHSERCLKAVEDLCNNLKIKLHVYNINMLKVFKRNKKKRLSNCVVCGVIKKYILNKQARKLRADKIATGHHLNDIAQTFLMNIFKGSVKLNYNLKPILDVKGRKFIPRIKPLFFVSEKEIESYTKKLGISFVKQVCPYRGESYRVETINFLKDFSDKDKKNLVKNIIKLSGKRNTKEEMIYCSVCGEPSRGRICKVCELVS